MWVRDLPHKDQPNFNKLKRIWQGPYEIFKVDGGGQIFGTDQQWTHRSAGVAASEAEVLQVP